jgi:hypothetical protein
VKVRRRMVSKNILMVIPKKRLISGTGRLLPQRREEIFRFFTRQSEIKGIRA